ncbi:unnamed protein product [Durusdinium trenchii]|uniref:phosphoethanolamine N-methyltransferase n=2 Tax=Durusdinium trenchii TaxID=1381693 RepID=A0ABP0J087_9DINO
MLQLHRATVFGRPRPRAGSGLGRLCQRGYLVDCSKIYLDRSSSGGFVSRARAKIRRGETLELGVVRLLPVEGSRCPLVLPWSGSRWASGSGCLQFYHATSQPEEASAKVVPTGEEQFVVIALRDIEPHEELVRLDETLHSRGFAAQPSAQVSNGAGEESRWIDCSKVEARPDAWGGVGVYATQRISSGELVERGVVQPLPVDGNICQYVFTWSEDRSVWATGSGCSVFYNASLDGSENTSMTRHLEDETFEIFALRDIEKGEELTHLYKSIEWRSCFRELKAIRDDALQRKTLDNERAEFTEYWADHSSPTIETMMLDTDAASIDKLERPEILSQIPSVAGKDVLELGAGIGRFSGLLARKARRVVAVDFVAAACAENRHANAEQKNLEVIQADVTALQLEPTSFDLVFSNWLFMYLTDEECRELAAKLLGWLRPGGHLFFRESCFHASGNAARRFNPTKYRTPEQKVSPANKRHLMMLQTGQYAPAKILRYEKIYGRGYIYTGGDEISQKLVDLGQPNLQPGASVLDVGCGAGGTAYYLASHCPGIFVHGANWSSEMASFNAGRLPQVPSELRARVSFELTPECGVPENELRYPPNIFDLVVIRETFMYLEPEDKAVILRKVKKMLRPGGRVLIIDYCRGRPALSQTFQSHIRRWHYDCSSPAELEELLAHHFEVSLAEDHTQDFIKYMEEGLARIEENLGPSTWKVGQMDLDNSQEKIQDALKGLPEEVQKEASEAAMEKLKLYKASIESDIEIQKEDYHWVKDTWSLERQAAMDGDLKWYIFVGKKGDLSS